MGRLRQATGVGRWAVVVHSWGAETRPAVGSCVPDCIAAVLRLAGFGAGDSWREPHVRERNLRLGADLRVPGCRGCRSAPWPGCRVRDGCPGAAAPVGPDRGRSYGRSVACRVGTAVPVGMIEPGELLRPATSRPAPVSGRRPRSFVVRMGRGVDNPRDRWRPVTWAGERATGLRHSQAGSRPAPAVPDAGPGRRGADCEPVAHDVAAAGRVPRRCVGRWARGGGSSASRSRPSSPGCTSRPGD